MLRAIHIFLFAVFVSWLPLQFIHGDSKTELSASIVPLESTLGIPNAWASDGDMDHDGIRDDEDDDKDGDGRRNHEDNDRDGDGVDNDEERERGSDPDDDDSVPTADVTPPVISIPASITVEATGITTPVPALGVASAIDDVDGPVPVSHDAPATFPLGSTTVTYTATDAAGNIATATQTVTITDTTPPSISIQQLAVTVEATAPEMPVDLGSVTATDLVDGAITPVSDAPTVFPLDVTQVTWTATDASGNASSVVQTVTVQDTTPPQITAPATVDASSPDGNPVPVATGQPTATDLFGPVTFTNDAPAVFSVGSTLVTWTAMDANGNSATAFQTVSVTDDQYLPGLPPDPGEAGKATLEGIDSDGDGVRDDVQRWIAINFPDSEKTRAALSQLAQDYQRFILGAADPTQIHDAAELMSHTHNCLSYIDFRSAYSWGGELKAQMLNTYDRSKAFLQADRHLSGRMYKGLPYNQRKQGCNFDPDVMPN